MIKIEETTQYNDVKQAIKDLDQVQRKYANYGARDTEPDYVLQRVIMDALAGKNGDIWKLSADELELFTSTMDCDRAAVNICGALKVVVNAIRRCTVQHLDQVGKMLQAYCWRIY